MSDLGWSIPQGPVDARMATEGIVSQHDQIRVLLGRALEIAEAALEGRASSPDAVASAIGDVRTTIEIHLDFEEKVLLPLVRTADAPNHRSDEVLRDHDLQRAMLATLHREARRGPELPMLAAKLAFLSSWLLKDMVAEEKALAAIAQLPELLVGRSRSV